MHMHTIQAMESVKNYVMSWYIYFATLVHGTTLAYDIRCNVLVNVDKSVTTFEIPGTITRIVDFAFNGCPALTSVEIPDSVINIGDLAFDRCSSLNSIEIPDSVTSIGCFAFKGCDQLLLSKLPLPLRKNIR